MLRNIAMARPDHPQGHRRNNRHPHPSSPPLLHKCSLLSPHAKSHPSNLDDCRPGDHSRREETSSLGHCADGLLPLISPEAQSRH